MKISTFVFCVLWFAVLAPAFWRPAQSSDGASTVSASPTLKRRYQDGEAISYLMKATNQSPRGTIQYSIQASGAVKKNANGALVEEFAWSGLTVNGESIELTPASRSFRQQLALSPDYTITIPPLDKVQPMLIGPITDLLTFYADLSLVMRQSGLKRVGDHVYFKYGGPNSWADGTYVVLGEDSIDFDMTLRTVDTHERTATVVVRHVPPAQPQVRLTAAWMSAPVADTQNNWVEVSKSGAEYAAKVGKEIFEVEMVVSLRDGKLVSAVMHNPVEVLERNCSDAALAICGEPTRYRILRTVSIN
ncbi:MAG TPA: hypothetical protein VGI47_01260 [Candidatus Binataceae bacterium]|jgi:hypothetical protein